MDKYFLVALPEANSLKKLNEIREYLYFNGFRYSNDLPTSDVHITLAQTNLEDEDILSVKSDLKNFLKDQESFSIEYDHVTNENRGSNEKYTEGYAWIALYINNESLKTLSKKLDGYLITKNISNTQDYIDEVGGIADHLNLCNYGRLDSADNAMRFIEANAPKSFEIKTIGLKKGKGGKVLWSIDLFERRG
ncbi:MAG: hypothetical protein ACMG57_03140 [Candidatus Dojkabacteria bacterium]